MDWNDASKYDQISGMLVRLLKTASNGIKEIDFYTIFGSPSPERILFELRYGFLSGICDVSLDRFGRRTYTYHYGLNEEKEKLINIHSDSIIDSLDEDSMRGLSDFVLEDNS